MMHNYHLMWNAQLGQIITVENLVAIQTRPKLRTDCLYRAKPAAMKPVQKNVYAMWQQEVSYTAESDWIFLAVLVAEQDTS